MSQYYKVPVLTRREVVDCFSHLKLVDSGKIKGTRRACADDRTAR